MLHDSHRGYLLSFRELVVLTLVALPLIVTVSAIEAADWVKGLPSLKILVVVSVLIWAYVARSSIPGKIAHPTALVLCVGAGFLIGSLTLSGNRGFSDLANQIGSWFEAIGGAGRNRGTAMTGVFLIGVTLFMSYLSVWFAYRRSFALLAALPGLGVLLIVLTFLTEDYYWYVFVYLLAAAPGIAYRQGGRWSESAKRVPLLGSLAAGGILMGLALLPVSTAPAPEGTVMPFVSELEEPWYSFSERWSSLFYAVPSRQNWPSFAIPDDLPFTGPIDELSDELLFIVESDEPYRWRTRVYETYTNLGWTNERPPEKTAVTDVPLQQLTENLQSRKEVQISVRMFSKANNLAAVGEPISADVPADVGLSPQPQFNFYLEGPQFSYLPSVIAEFRDGLVERGSVQDQFSTSELNRLGFRSLLSAEAAYLALQRVESGVSPPLTFASQSVLVPPRRYTTVGSVSTATPAMLREAGRDYPNWVTDRYLQLTDGFPESVVTLAEELAKGQDNPYDMAEAIRQYLLTLPYSLQVTHPPPGQDWVEHFLFVQRKGYCQNYASSMITMLRSLGVPARLAVGFAPGIWDEGRGAWEVQALHYHAWPEVYFPQYGWVEFEPTPPAVQPALGHLGIESTATAVNPFLDPDFCIEDFGLGNCDTTDIDTGTGADELVELTPDDSQNGIGDAASAGGAGGTFSSYWALIGLALVLALVVPASTISYARWSLGRLGYPTVAYATMSLLGRFAGVRRQPQETPWEYSFRLSGEFPEHTEAVEAITVGFVTTRYGPSKSLASKDIEGLRASWRAVRMALFTRILRRLIPFRK